MVARSTSKSGPFVDRAGQPAVQGHFTTVIDARCPGFRPPPGVYGRGIGMYGAGGASVYTVGGTDLIVFHWYDTSRNHNVHFSVQRLGWNNEWPYVF